MNWTNANYVVDDDKSRLRIPEIRSLMQQGEWCADYSEEIIERLIQNSFWLGLFLNGCLVGLARVVTDKETVSLITDFIIDEPHRGNGLGSWLMKCLIAHPELHGTSMSLGTQDADLFFNKFGFERVGSFMHRFQRPDPRPRRSSGSVGFPPKSGSLTGHEK
jgi:GNAT superfamily N-acetyltransferase